MIDTYQIANTATGTTLGVFAATDPMDAMAEYVIDLGFTTIFEAEEAGVFELAELAITAPGRVWTWRDSTWTETTSMQGGLRVEP